MNKIITFLRILEYIENFKQIALRNEKDSQLHTIAMDIIEQCTPKDYETYGDAKLVVLYKFIGVKGLLQHFDSGKRVDLSHLFKVIQECFDPFLYLQKSLF